MIEADARELGECDGQEREVNAGDAVTEGEGAEQSAEGGANKDRQPDSDPRTDAIVKIERAGGIAADAEVQGMAERQLAGEAHHDVPRLAGVGEKQEERGNG